MRGLWMITLAMALSVACGGGGSSNPVGADATGDGGRTVTPTVSGTCGYSVATADTARSIAAAGGTIAVHVTTPATSAVGCTWTVSIAEDARGFITIVDPTTGTSTATDTTVSFAIAPNTGGRRIGVVTIAGVAFTITQTEAACVLSVSPESVTVSADGGSASITITRTQGASCTWQAVSNVPFISITGATSGVDDGRVTVAVSANTGTASRTGTVSVAGQAVTVTQSAPQTCQFAVSPTTVSVGPGVSSASINVSVTSGTNCQWAAAGNSFAALTSASTATGNGTSSFTVDVNTGPARSTVVTVAGQAVTILQGSFGPVITAAACSALHSIEGTVATSIVFYNARTQPVNIYWLDYNGARQLYNTVGPREEYTQATFLTHPWIAADPGGTCLGLFMPLAQAATAVIR